MTAGNRAFQIDGFTVPLFLYGTAWKEDATQQLVETALQQGFRGIDTANQRRHYYEAAVGQGIQAMIQRGAVTRDDLFLQTKYTFQGSQDQRLPYDPQASITNQVQQSFASSLEHLGVTWIDSYVLHGPTVRSGLSAVDREAWRAMETIYDSGKVRLLGVSNVTLEQIQLLYRQSRVKPRFVQNRRYAIQGWDRDIRDFCRANDIVYQGFSLLTANRNVLVRPELVQIAKRYQCDVNQIVFRFALDVGMLPLTGTTNANHMRDDLGIFDFQLQPDEIRLIETLG